MPMLTFQNREAAGKLLAEKLKTYAGNSKVVVVSLPRGGVVLGYEIAQALHAPHDIVVTRKIGYPENKEFAICVTDASGTVLCSSAAESVDSGWIQEEAQRQQAEAVRREEVYRGGNPPINLSGKIVILVDDGIATGLTITLAITAIKEQQPEKIIVATPVMPQEVYKQLASQVDSVVTLIPPSAFQGSVGAHYADFAPVKDEQVLHLLHGIHK